MTAKAALCQLLLEGKVLNVKNCFTLIGLTNCSREISRMVEKPFGVVISRDHRAGKSRYGQPVTWVNYHLNFTDYNKEGIEKMKAYLESQSVPKTEEKTVVSEYVRRKRKSTEQTSVIKQNHLF